MNKKKFTVLAVLTIATVLAALPVFAQDISGAEEAAKKAFSGKNYSPYAGRAYPTRVLYGDTHLHTAI